MTIGQLPKYAGIDSWSLGFWETCVVVTDRRISQGVLRDGNLDADSGATTGDAMTLGATTYKPNTEAAEPTDRMRERGRTLPHRHVGRSLGGCTPARGRRIGSGGGAMRVELLDFDGCPSYLVAQERLWITLVGRSLPADIEMAHVQTDEAALPGQSHYSSRRTGSISWWRAAGGSPGLPGVPDARGVIRLANDRDDRAGAGACASGFYRLFLVLQRRITLPVETALGVGAFGFLVALLGRLQPSEQVLARPFPSG